MDEPPILVPPVASVLFRAGALADRSSDVLADVAAFLTTAATSCADGIASLVQLIEPLVR